LGIAVACIPPVVPAVGSRRLAVGQLRGGFNGAGKPARRAAVSRRAVLLTHGKTDEAATELETALRLDPRLAAAHEDLGSIFGKRGDLVAAEREFREAYRI